MFACHGRALYPHILTSQDQLFKNCYFLPYGEEGSYPVNVCMGIRLTDTIQAEFIYYGLEEERGLRQVRYAAATFYEEEGMEATSINDQNMQLNPQVQWPMEGIFNSFGWIEAAFTLEAEPEKTPTDLFRNPLNRRF